MEPKPCETSSAPWAEAETAPAPTPASRRIGFLEGQGSIGPEFFDPLPEDELRLWNGEGD
jgi:hypothetical protein